MSFAKNSLTASDTVLVVGGVGFIGYHLVTYFNAHRTFANVAVLSRSAASSENRVEGATYYTGDITDRDSIKKIIDQIQPTVIIHAASPSPVTGTPKEYNKVNIRGTTYLLEVAKESECVRAFIYTSSSLLAEGREHINLDETCAMADTDLTASPYAVSKAVAENMVLKENSPKPATAATWKNYLATAALRFPSVYGIREHMGIPGCMNALANGQTTTTLGDGTNLWSFCSAENTASSHALLAAALLSPLSTDSSKKVDGEAFNINDGTPYPFWGYARLCWQCAGYDAIPVSNMTHLPTWFVLSLATLLEWVYWIFTLGTKRPYTMGKQQVEYACFTHTYSIEKARARLGFTPKEDFEGGIKEAVEWCLNNGGWREKLKNIKGIRLPKT